MSTKPTTDFQKPSTNHQSESLLGGVRWSRLQTILGAAGFVAGLWMLFDLIRSNDFSSAPAILLHVGAWAALAILIPYSIAAMIDTAAWRRMLATGKPIPFRKVFRIRTASEALVITVPLGSVLSDPFKAWMLKREFGLAYSTTAASIVFRKALLGISQGFVALATTLLALSFPTLLRTSAIGPTLIWTVFFCSAGVFAVYGLLIALISYGSFVDRLHGWLSRLPFRRLASWFERKEPQFRECNAQLRAFRGGRSLFLWIAAYVFLWSIEDLETLFIVSILGINLTVPEALVMESACVLLRTAAPMVPGGIGVQDTGYASMLLASGHSGSVAGAFVVLKRFREVVWAALGYVYILVSRRAESLATPAFADSSETATETL